MTEQELPLETRVAVARAALMHLHDGLDLAMLTEPGGAELLEERLVSLPENVSLLVELSTPATV